MVRAVPGYKSIKKHKIKPEVQGRGIMAVHPGGGPGGITAVMLPLFTSINIWCGGGAELYIVYTCGTSETNKKNSYFQRMDVNCKKYY